MQMRRLLSQILPAGISDHGHGQQIISDDTVSGNESGTTYLVCLVSYVHIARVLQTLPVAAMKLHPVMTPIDSM